MVRFMAVAVRVVCVVLVSLPLMAQTSNDPVPESRLVVRDPGNILGAGTLVVLRPSATQSFATVTVDSGDDGIVERIHLFIHDPAAPNQESYSDWELFFTRANGGIMTTGTIPTRNNQEQPDLAKLAAHLNNRACNALIGSLTAVQEIEYTDVPSDGFRENIKKVTRLKGQFNYKCATNVNEEGPISGDFFYAEVGADGGDSPDDGGDDGGDDDGGDDEPTPPPPPPFQVTLPTELGITPLGVTNASSHSVAITTSTDGTFNSDIHLAVLTSADEFSDFHAEVSPSVIAAPGDGEATLTIRTGPLTLPRDYTVTVYAISGETIHASSFVVRVDCTPPFILGVDQPKSVANVVAGTQTTLEVKPGGSGPFFYQWYRGMPGMANSPVAAENNARFVLTARETGPYWVRVRNACGSVDSTAAMVTVAAPPATTTFTRRGSRP
jgi:hypothetical protein